jgi:hypothetical protein
MRTTKLIAVAVASVAATAAFILACGKGPGAASAQGCTAWEISVVDYGVSSTDCGGVYPRYPATCRMGNGWEPFTTDNNGDLILRRCAP